MGFPIAPLVELLATPALVGGTSFPDVSGNGINGTLTSYTTGGFVTTGNRPGGTANLAGDATGYVNNTANALLANLGPLSVAAWLYNAGTSVGNVAYKRKGSGGGWSFDVFSGGLLQFRVYYSGANVQRLGLTNWDGRGTGWHRVVYTWDGTTAYTGAHMYLDGTEIAYDPAQNQNGTNTHQDDSTQALLWGNANADTVGSWPTFSDDLLIFGIALTAAQVAALDQNLHSRTLCGVGL